MKKWICSKLKVLTISVLIITMSSTPVLASNGDLWKGTSRIGSVAQIMLTKPSTFLDLLANPSNYLYEVNSKGYSILDADSKFKAYPTATLSEVQSKIENELVGSTLSSTKTLTATYGDLLGVTYARATLPDTSQAVTSVKVDGIEKTSGKDYNVTSAGVITIMDVTSINTIVITTTDGTTYTVSSSTSNVTISSVSSISKTINQGDSYSLPSTVEATMSDGSKKQVSVTWNPSTVNTSEAGIQTFSGSITGYSKQIKLTLTIDSTAEVRTGSISGVITWQYNKYIGTKADVGAKIALIPTDLDKNSDNYLFALLLQQSPQGANGIYTGKADGYGSYKIDEVPVGKYYLLIYSNNTFSDGVVQEYDKQRLIGLFSDKSWTSLKNLLSIRKYELIEVEIKDGQTLTESYDFGNTYI